MVQTKLISIIPISLSNFMRITLIVLGKTTEKYLNEGIDIYLKRINRYCKFNIKALPELKNTKSMPVELQRAKEGDILLEEMAHYQECILLDEHGKHYRSEEFAAIIEKKLIIGKRDLAFIVGGPYGFDPRVVKAAHSQLSLSPMTFSHQLIRLIFVEQLYRAFTIIRGEPYHNP